MPDLTNVPGATSQSLLTAEQARSALAVASGQSAFPFTGFQAAQDNARVAQAADH